MSLLVSLAIISVLLFAAFSGSKRGLVLIGLELISFVVATLLALAAYHQGGALLRYAAHISVPLSNVAAFIVIWGLVEVGCAILIRFVILPRLRSHAPLSTLHRVGGSVLNTLKTAAIITLGLIIFSGLPLTSNMKRPVTEAFGAQQLLAASGDLQAKLGLGLVRDLSDSLTLFTITSDPENEKSIDLGFTTLKVSVDAQEEAAMLVLINRERTSRGLDPLTRNDKARAVARAYSADMFARGFFSHVNPEGKTPFDRMKAGKVPYASAGENLALAPTLQLAHTGLMNSPGHRANILSREYHTVGIGIIDGGPYGLMVTQNFTD